eukprot:1922552-Prymnesium_polylepis.2
MVRAGARLTRAQRNCVYVRRGAAARLAYDSLGPARVGRMVCARAQARAARGDTARSALLLVAAFMGRVAQCDGAQPRGAQRVVASAACAEAARAEQPSVLAQW